MKFSKTFALAGFLAGALILSGPIATVEAHGNGNGNGHGKSKHNYCYDKHGRWRSHPHCPPQRNYYHGHRRDGDHYNRYSYYHRRSGSQYQSQPQIIYVRKDGPFDPRARQSTQTVRDSAKSYRDARNEVQQGREQLRKDHMELKSDRAELRRDLRNKVGKEEITKDRQEIRADLAKIKATKQELRNDRSERDIARQEWKSGLGR